MFIYQGLSNFYDPLPSNEQNIFTAHPQMRRQYLQPTPITWLCHSIDMNICSRIIQKVFTAPLLNLQNVCGVPISCWQLSSLVVLFGIVWDRQWGNIKKSLEISIMMLKGSIMMCLPWALKTIFPVHSFLDAYFLGAISKYLSFPKVAVKKKFQKQMLWFQPYTKLVKI